MTFQQQAMEQFNVYLDKLANFRAADMSQSQTALVFGLGLVGGVWLLTQVLTFIRVLLSLFVLPGKSVHHPHLQLNLIKMLMIVATLIRSQK
jgi:17beta-estradiol 17-dehydrogenase / very-long-chain 3-oxoacyl-CoA reductase